MIGRIANDLTAPLAGKGGEPVVEHDDFVVGFRDLAWVTGPGRAQRAIVGGGEVGPDLAVRGVHHPVP